MINPGESVDTEHIKVLLVDDDQGDFEMIRVMLSKTEHQKFKLDWVSTYEEARDAFEANNHDVYFLDYFLEDRTGLDLLREARELGIKAPIIMLTGRGSRKVDMEAMELGASDYLVKGLIDPDSLERAIRHAMERAEGAQAIQERDEQLRSFGPPSTGEIAPVGLVGSAAMFRAVFDSSRSGIAVLGLDGNIMQVNPPFAATFSPSPRWTEGLTYLELLDETDREAVGKEMKALSSGSRARFEAARRFLNRDGKLFWAHTTMSLIRNEEGAPSHLVVVAEKVASEG
jgi:PAS domain S-box-containing protein